MTASDREYFASKALNNGAITLLLECPARYKAVVEDGCDDDDKDSDALKFGSMVHTLTLQRETFSEQYAVTDLNLATKEGKAWKASVPEGVEIVKGKDYERALMMAESVRGHNQVRALFDNPHVCEQPVYFTFEGIDCKCKPDIVTDLPDGRRILGDLKTTDSANPKSCERSIVKYGYYRQAAWYLTGMEAIGKPCDNFVIIFVEKRSPHLVTAFDISQEAIGQGMGECLRAIETLKECRKNKHWPCYTRDILTFNMPEWALKE